MSDKHPPTVDPQAAQRWQQLPMVASPWLHEEVARRMQERLDYIKCQPTHWLHWMPVSGGLQSHTLLAQRYPKAVCAVLESTPIRVARAVQAIKRPFWALQRWLQAPTQVSTQVKQPAQMLWANMNLHMAAQPQALIAQWHQALQVDGFLMFSCLGPDTLKELRGLYKTLNWPAPSHEFTDMHDWGDMLVAAGFAEPVMDMERITLTFDSPQRLLQELRGLGRNLHVGRFQGLRGRRWHTQLLQAIETMPLQLTFEVVYGHAFKPAPRLSVSAHSEITLDNMRAALRQGKQSALEKKGAVHE
jgi:malonyl-CoA O-methyltransferase